MVKRRFTGTLSTYTGRQLSVGWALSSLRQRRDKIHSLEVKARQIQTKDKVQILAGRVMKLGNNLQGGCYIFHDLKALNQDVVCL